MIFLNIFLCIIISVYESLALKSMRPDGEIPNRDGSTDKVYIIDSCNGTRVTNGKAVNDVKLKILPPGFIITPGAGIHKFHSETRNWYDARKICNQEGGNLCVISNAKENALVRDAGYKVGAKQVYLGMHDLFAMQDWVTIFDQPLNGTFTDWCLNEPNNGLEKQNEHCGTYWLEYNSFCWNDNKCDDPHQFMCEIHTE